MAAKAIVPERPAMWLGHYSNLFLLAAVAVSVADDAAGRPDGALSWVTSAAWVAWMVTWAAEARHHERLCERCVAATPLDPQAAVTRWRRALRLHHERRAMMTLFSGIIAWDIAEAFFRHPPSWALALDALATVIVGSSFVVTWQHRRLYPWCPFCRWGDGGDHEVSPDIPAPAATR